MTDNLPKEKLLGISKIGSKTAEALQIMIKKFLDKKIRCN